jgi:hypothetical protein
VTTSHDVRAWCASRRLEALLLRGSRVSTADGVVSLLTAVQAQEHQYGRWSVAQRCSPAKASAADVDQAFDDGRILRTHILRPTWHYVAPADLRWLTRLSAPRLLSSATKRFSDLGLDPQTLNRSTDVIVRSLAEGPRTRKELAGEIAGAGVGVEGQRLPHMLMFAEITAAVTSGPMRGKQHTYALFDERVPVQAGPDREEALSLLAWRYFSTRGPATLKDFAWWAGLMAGDARTALAAVRSRLDSYQDGSRTFWFPDNEPPPTGRSATPPQVDLIQCFDELIISYSESRDMLHTEDVSFRTPLNTDGYRHVVVLEGRLLGHWRVNGAGQPASIETRLARQLEPSESPLLAEAVESYRIFATSSD